MADKPPRPKKDLKPPPKKAAKPAEPASPPPGLERAPELRFATLSPAREAKQPVKINTSAIYFIVLILVGVAAVPLGYYLITGQNPILALQEKIAPPPNIPSPVAQPKVTIEIQHGKNGDTLIVRWDNLPAGTARVKIYRAKAGTTDWTLWKTENLAIGGSAGGSAESGSVSIALGKKDDGYVYYVQAVAGAGSGQGAGASGTSSGEVVLWESSSTAPTTVSSTATTATMSTTNSTISSATTSTSSASTGSTATTTTSESTSTTTAATTTQSSNATATSPTGIPYYTPQGTISGYGQPQAGNFWAQHTDDKIDIGWQNLPAGTTKFIVSRSQSSSGPWSQVLTQTNPPLDGPYSIKIVDQTLYDPYYYKMDVYAGVTLTDTYGPVLLPALQ